MLERCELVSLEFGTVLCEPGESYRYVYFPLNGFFSLVATVQQHPSLGMGLIGNEGMLGATMVLGVNAVPLQSKVQSAGNALRMTAAQLRREMRLSPALCTTLQHYLFVLMAQLSQSAACTRFHEADARLARWLLEAHDRAHVSHLELTHNALADMLGVRRSAVTIAAGDLQRKQLIRYSRGAISITNRKGLEAASCECYSEAKEDYAQIFS
jgi:CRP-like cAMP-binding protein